MLWNDAEAAIRTYVENAWPFSPYGAIPLVWENEVVPYEGAYLVVTIEGVNPPGKTIYGSVGKRLSVDRGLIFYHAFVPASIGKQAALGPVVAMAGILELQPNIIGPGLNTYGANTPSPVAQGDADPLITSPQPGGMYYRCSGSVPFILINAV